MRVPSQPSRRTTGALLHITYKGSDRPRLRVGNASVPSSFDGEHAKKKETNVGSVRLHRNLCSTLSSYQEVDGVRNRGSATHVTEHRVELRAPHLGSRV